MEIISRIPTSGRWAAFLRPAALLATVAPAVLGGPVVQNLSSNGGVQSWTVPNGVEVVALALTGAQGGRGSDDVAGVGATGGDGGRVTGRLAVTAGEVLTLHLGGSGGPGSLASNGGGGSGGIAVAGLYSGGRGGNAGGVLTSGGGGGGGGAAAILRGSTLLAVAGGAGGGGGAGGSTEWFLSFNQANRDGVSGVSGSYTSANTGANGIDRGTGNDGGGGGGGGGGVTRGGTGGTLRITGNNNTGGNGGSAGENLSSGLASATASYAAVSGAAAATISYLEPALFNAVFTSAASVPVTATSVDVSNATLNLQLGHAPTAGGVLTVANNSGTTAVTGTFVGLAQGAQVTATYAGDSFRFTLSYTGGTGNDITLTREAARLPLVTGGASSLLGSENATLAAAVNPNGFTTTALVEYGYSNLYGRTRAFTLAPANGSVSQSVSTILEALKPGTLYHYRISVTNVDGTAATADGTFSTRAGGTVSPGDRIAGMQDQTLVITGGGFLSGATVAFSGGGITVKSVTVNSAQQLSVVIDIDRAAAPGARSLTVTNPDGSRWIASGLLDAAGFDPGIGANGEVLAVLPQSDGKTLIGGGFTSFDSYPSKRLARLNADGSFDTTFVPVIDGAVRAIVRQADGKILIGGDFTTVGVTARARVARLNTDGTLDTTFAPGTAANAAVRALLLQADGKLLIGGDFTSVNGSTRNRLARLLANGSVDSSYNPNVNGPVHALLAHPSGALVGGAFGMVGANPVCNIALLSAAGVPNLDFSNYTVIGETDFGQRVSGSVAALALDADGRILVGGDFLHANGLACKNVARVDSDGMVDVVGTVNGPVSAVVALADGGLLAAGNFQKGVARLTSTLAADSSLATNADAAVLAMALQADGKLLVGGAFTTVDGVARRGIARFTAAGGLDLPERSAAFTVWEPMRLDSVDVTGLAQGLSNRSLVLTGAGFKPGATLTFSNSGITLASLAVNSTTRMTAVVNVAASATPGPVTLTVNNLDGGSDSLAAAFTVSARPVIASVTPAARAAGSQNGQLVIDGSHFQAGATVGISGSGVTLSNLAVLSGTLTARIDLATAASAGSRDLIVSNPDGGTLTQVAAFTVNAAPTLASLSPSTRAVGLQGQSLVLTGSYFQAGAQVAFSGSGITVTGVSVDSPTQLTVLADLDSAATPGPRDVTVSQPDGGSVTLAGALSLAARPLLTAVSPAEIPQGGGKTVTLSGTGFTAGSTLAIASDGITLRSFNVVSATEISADLIVSQRVETGSYALTVSNPDGGSATLDAAIRVTPGPQILALTPSRRVVGMQNQTLVLSGTNFGPTLSVRFSGDGITVDSVTVDSETSVTLVVDIAADALAGGRNLSVTNPDRGTFTLENALTLSALPKLTGVAPAARGQGALDQELLIFGSGLQDQAQVEFGEGITVKQVTRQSETQLTAVVDISPFATLGGRSVTLTNPDSGSVTVAPVVLNPGFIAAGAGPDGAVRSVCQTSDGKIVIAGAFTHIGPVARGHLARLNADGTLDPSFDPGTGFNGDVAEALLQSDGKILAAGAFSAFNGSPCGPVVRLNADGSIDSGFTAAASLAGTQVLRIARQNDGKLVVATQASLLRLLADGSADAGFTPVNRPVSVLALQADGKILAAGAGFLARYSDSGALENSLSLGPLTCTALALQPDGKIVFGGTGGEGGAFARLKADFTMDSTFSAGQLGYFPITALVRLSDGRFMAAAALGGNSAVFRAGVNGTWDTTFAAATGGFAQADGPVATLLPQADGKLLLGGMFTGNLSRIGSDGVLDIPQIASPFKVNAAPSLASLDLTAIGQGAESKAFLVRGTGFVGTPSAFFTTPGVTVDSCNRNSDSALSLRVSVAPGTQLGATDLIVVNDDGGRARLVDALTISPAPQLTAVSPSVCGQGALGLQLEVSGNDLQTGAQVVAFWGIEGQFSWTQTVVSPQRMTLSLTIAEDAKPGVARMVLINPDGGRTELADALTVTPGPKVTAISPNRLGAGALDAPLVIRGSNFATGATVTFTQPGVRVKSVSVDSSTQLTVIADVDGAAALGEGGFTVMNPDHGTDTVPSIGFTAGFIVGKGLEMITNGYNGFANASAMVVQPDGGI
ncbi:IPT/TIG domain-containing protein, partial [bacterium]|nr:IPT/TIG domain-containing protein [bacterium]